MPERHTSPVVHPTAGSFRDAEGRFSVLLEQEWRVLEQRTSVSRLLLFRAPSQSDAVLSISFTAVAPGTDAESILSYRRAAEGGARGAETPVRFGAGPVELVGAAWRERSGERDLMVEEACAVVGACAVLLRTQFPADALALETRIRGLRKSLVLTGVQPPPGAPPLPAPLGTAGHRVVARDIEVAYAPQPFRVSVTCALTLETLRPQTVPLCLLLPPYPFARVEAVRGPAGEDIPHSQGHENGVQVVEVAPGSLPAQDCRLTLAYSMHCAWGDPAQHRAHGVYSSPVDLVCMGSLWLPRVQGALPGPVPYTIRVVAPPGFHALGAGRGRARDVAIALLGGSSDAVVEGDRSPPRVSVHRGPAGTPTRDIVECLEQSVALMESWVCPAPQARSLDVIFHAGETSHGFGSLLLIGRTFQTPGVPMDLRWMGQSTLRETLLHELSHLWFGGLLHGRGDNPDEAQEALAGFFALRLLGAIRGHDTHEESRSALARQYRAACASGADQVPSQYEGRVQAVWGALALTALRESVGPDAFDEALRSYFRARADADGAFSVAALLDAVDAETGATSRALLASGGFLPPR